MPEASGFTTKKRIGFDIALSAFDSESMVSTKYTISSELARKERRAAHKVLFKEEI